MKVKFGNPTDDQRYRTMVAIAQRQMAYQKLLWKLLREAMSEGRRLGQDAWWREKYIRLLERAARHERRIQRMYDAGNDWIFSRSMQAKRPSLRIVRSNP